MTKPFYRVKYFISTYTTPMKFSTALLCKFKPYCRDSIFKLKIRAMSVDLLALKLLKRRDISIENTVDE